SRSHAFCGLQGGRKRLRLLANPPLPFADHAKNNHGNIVRAAGSERGLNERIACCFDARRSRETASDLVVTDSAVQAVGRKKYEIAKLQSTLESIREDLCGSSERPRNDISL